MGSRTITTQFDDLDNSITEDVETLTFAVGRNSYTIDLGPENREKFFNALDPFIKVAAKANASSNSGSKKASVPAREIRAWAKEQPAEISSLVKSDRGAVPKAVIAAYNAANGTDY